MSEIMKQRLVGAIVLGCLAIIFVPIVLDGDGIAAPDSVAIEVPLTPAIPDMPDNLLADEEEILPEVVPSQELTTIEQDAEESTLPEPDEQVVSELPNSDVPALDTDGLPQGWVVRLGAFAERANAEGLEQRLLAAEHKAYIRPVSGSNGNLAGVYVGPVLTRADAEDLKQELAQSLELEGVVEQFAIDD